MGVFEVAEYYGVSRALAHKWTGTDDFPEPFAVLRMGTAWETEKVLAWGKRHGRRKGAGPRQAGGAAHDRRKKR
jgi:predicted DNA-binding transcriptional regulator AlpA